MKVRLLKKLRKEAKKYIYLYPCEFKESYDQCFSYVSTPVEIQVSCEAKLMKKYKISEDYAMVDGVEFTSMFLGISWVWCGECRLDEAKKILRKLRREYILQEVERLKDERLFNNNEKEYEKFKKYITSL